MSSRLTLGVVVPAFNEGGVILEITDSIPAEISLNKKVLTIQMIIVNDGSTDNTAAQVRKKDGVILINHLLNSGAGAATRTGLHCARDLGCDFVVTMDADGQHSVKDMISVVKSVVNGGADFVIGSRLKQSNGNMPLAKKVGNWGLSFITFLLLGVYVSDSQSGLKALNQKALQAVDFHSNNYAFSSEMIWKAHQAGLTIKEVPVEAIYTEYSKSRGQKNFTGAIEITKQLIKRRFLSFLNE